jgi:hypothetical protein
MSEIKNSTTDKTVAYVSGDGIFNATTGRKSQIIKDGKIYSSITGELIGTYSGGGSGSGGGSSEGFGKYRVRFFDYDGTILKTVYTDGGAVTAPSVPEHERLLFQEWNNDFDNITSDLDVGAIYTTKSGKCEFDVWVNNQVNELSPDSKIPRTVYMGVNLISGTVTVEWGDGETETLSTVGIARLTHTYPETGKYILMVSGDSEWTLPNYAFSSNGTGGTGRHDTNVTDVRLAKFQRPRQDSVFTMLAACETLTLDKESIGTNQRLFCNMRCLRHLNLPRGMRGNLWLVDGCTNLKHIVLPLSFDYFDYGFAGGCYLEDLVIPPNTTCLCSLPPFAMREITVPGKVNEIKDRTFFVENTYSALRSVVMQPGVPPTLATSTVFQLDGSLKEIIVPAGCAEAYKSATNWSTFADIIKEEE